MPDNLTGSGVGLSHNEKKGRQRIMTFLNDEAWQGRVYSGGWITSDGGESAVIEPATGRELGRIGIATSGDVTRAVKLAAAAQPAWEIGRAHV